MGMCSTMGLGSGAGLLGGARMSLMEASSSFRRRLRFLLSLIRDVTTTSKLLSTIRNKAPGTGSSFTLVRCVQGERLARMRAQEMEDHLWCARLSGRWTDVGLVTWGVGCGSDTPGVYAK